MDRRHAGRTLDIGATVGSVIPTKGAIIPAAVGVDIGCGMMAVQTSLNARNLPDNLKGIRAAIEAAVPHGRTNHGEVGDRGAWHDIPTRNQEVWLGELKGRYEAILAKHPKLDRGNHANHLGTLGTAPPTSQKAISRCGSASGWISRSKP
jgi:tRNA-splicing ligase RtcB